MYERCVALGVACGVLLSCWPFFRYCNDRNRLYLGARGSRATRGTCCHTSRCTLSRASRARTDAIVDFRQPFCACDIKVVSAHTVCLFTAGDSETHTPFSTTTADRRSSRLAALRRHTPQTRQGVRNPRPRACLTAGVSTVAGIQRPASIGTTVRDAAVAVLVAGGRANTPAAALAGSRAAPRLRTACCRRGHAAAHAPRVSIPVCAPARRPRRAPGGQLAFCAWPRRSPVSAPRAAAGPPQRQRAEKITF